MNLLPSPPRQHHRHGGAVYEVADWISANPELDLSIISSVYVDAVNHEQSTSETRVPPGAQFLLNIYQSQNTLLQDKWLNGEAVDANSSIPLIQLNCDQVTNLQTHYSIDEYAVPFILELLTKQISQ